MFFFVYRFLYDTLHKRYSSLSFSSFYDFNSSRTRQHSLCIVPLQSTINAYRYSFFVNAPFIWNSIPHCILFLTKVDTFQKVLRTYLFGKLFFSVSFNFLYVVMRMFVVIYVASHVCCMYFREAPLYRQSLLVQPCL